MKCSRCGCENLEDKLIEVMEQIEARADELLAELKEETNEEVNDLSTDNVDIVR